MTEEEKKKPKKISKAEADKNNDYAQSLDDEITHVVEFGEIIGDIKLVEFSVVRSKYIIVFVKLMKLMEWHNRQRTAHHLLQYMYRWRGRQGAALVWDVFHDVTC